MRKRGLVLSGAARATSVSCLLFSLELTRSQASNSTPERRDSLPTTPTPVRISFASRSIVGDGLRIHPLPVSAPSTIGLRRGSRISTHSRKRSIASIKSTQSNSIIDDKELWAELERELGACFEDITAIDVPASLSRAATRRRSTRRKSSTASNRLSRRLTRADSLVNNARLALRRDAYRQTVYEEAALGRLARSDSEKTGLTEAMTRDGSRDSYIPALDLALTDSDEEEWSAEDGQGGEADTSNEPAIWPPTLNVSCSETMSPAVTPLFTSLAAFQIDTPVNEEEAIALPYLEEQDVPKRTPNREISVHSSLPKLEPLSTPASKRSRIPSPTTSRLANPLPSRLPTPSTSPLPSPIRSPSRLPIVGASRGVGTRLPRPAMKRAP